MAQWGQQRRIAGLRDTLLPNLGAIWRGTEPEFTEFVIKTIKQMPEPVKSAMERHYSTSGTQYKNPETGRSTPEDSRYYLLLTQGRSILATAIRIQQNDKSILRLLERVYGE